MRLGKFYVSSILVKEEINDLADILGKMNFVPTRVEYLYHADKFEYVGYSYLFDECPLGVEIPEYRINYHLDGVEAEKV